MPEHRDLGDQYRTSSNLEDRIRLHQRFSTNKRGWMPWVFDHFNFPAQCRILELGCGTGKLWFENAERIPPDWDITLSDFSPGMLEKAQHTLAPLERDFHFRVFDASTIPFGAAEFDAVIANHMLYHVPDLPKTLSEIQRVLRLGGMLYAATNGKQHMRELDDLAPSFLPFEPIEEVIYQFTLENGRDALAPYFAEVTLYRMDDALVVDEPAPLVAYMLSRTSIFSGWRDLSEGQRNAFARHIEARMRAEGGAIRITKNTGLFVATKGEPESLAYSPSRVT